MIDDLLFTDTLIKTDGVHMVISRPRGGRFLVRARVDTERQSHYLVAVYPVAAFTVDGDSIHFKKPTFSAIFSRMDIICMLIGPVKYRRAANEILSLLLDLNRRIMHDDFMDYEELGREVCLSVNHICDISAA